MVYLLIIFATIIFFVAISISNRKKQSAAYNKVWDASEAIVYREFGIYQIPMSAKEAIMFEQMSREEKRQLVLALKKGVSNGTVKLEKNKFIL